WHSHGLDCGSSPISNNCTALEYGDSLDVMGAAVPPKHFNAVQKELLGWLNYGSSPPITTVTASGTYALDPYEPVGSDPKALKVKTQAGDWYYIEYRQAIGFDASTVSSNANVKSGVVVHFWSQSNPNGIYLLDMTAGTGSWSDPALDVGSSFSDDATGISITPVWANSTAGVNVTIGGSGGGSSCVHKNPTVTVSPAQQQGMPGTTVTYTVSVTNNDVGCSPSSFNTQAVVPPGWAAAAFAAAALTIGSGATGSVNMQVTSPTTAPSGTYSISSTVSDAAAPSYSG